MKKVLIACMVVLLALPSLAFAEEIMFMEFDITREGKVSMNWLSVIEGSPDQSVDGNYAAVVLDREGSEISRTKFSVSFYMSGTYEELSQRTVMMKIPYREDAYAVQIQKNGAMIFSYPIGSVCDSNLKCEGNENYASCSSDCQSGGRDNYCDGVQDGRCDPDCAVSGDVDCAGATTGAAETVGKGISPLLVAGVAAVAVIILLAVFLLRRKPAKKRKHR